MLKLKLKLHFNLNAILDNIANELNLFFENLLINSLYTINKDINKKYFFLFIMIKKLS